MTRLLLVVAALMVVLAAAGVGAGAEWDVYPGAGGGTIYVHEGTNARECRCEQADHAGQGWRGCVRLLKR